MKLRKLIALQLVMISVVSFTACGTVDRKSNDSQDDSQYETIINKLFSDEDKETKDYLNSLVIKNAGETSTNDLTFSVDELIYDSATGMGAYQLTIKSKSINLSTMKNNLPDYYAFICEDFKLELCDGMIPLGAVMETQDYEKELFKNYEYEVINDNEICIWGPYAEGNTFDINVEDSQENTKCLHLELPQEDNHIEIKVDNENIEGFYISPIGVKIDTKCVDGLRLGKMENVEVNYKDGNSVNLYDIIEGAGGGGNGEVYHSLYAASKRFFVLDDIKSVTVDGKEYFPE